MFGYHISPRLLKSIKDVALLVQELNQKHLPAVVLADFQSEAEIQSAYSSTSIEGNPLPLTEVKRILKNKPQNLRNSEQEVVNYNEALIWLNQTKLEEVQFGMDIILKIHAKVMRKLISKNNLGKFRKEPVFVNDPKARKTIFWPPDDTDVDKLMNELVLFVNQNKDIIDPLIIAGIFHRQFVIIHPFIDGNGRTVRLATKILLAQLGVNLFNLFSFENYYNQNVTKYFQTVGVKGNYYDIVNKIDHTAWLEYFVDGILDELYRVKKQLDKAKHVSPENALLKDQEEIIRFIQNHGYIRDSDYSKITHRAKATRALDFKKLIKLGLIEKQGKGPATYYKLKSNV